MTEGDLDEVVVIEKKVFADPWPKLAFKYDMENDYAIPLSVKLQGIIAGYASTYHVEDEMQIGNIAVSPDFQHQGIGSKLMAHIIQEAIGLKLKHIYLEVRQSNEIAIKLYYKFGFVIWGCRRLYYRHPTEDALIMVKEIN
jgi:ribosomal-protein-alanine N-acetyltransferase